MGYMHFFDIFIGFYGLKFLYQWYQVKFRGVPIDPQCLLPVDLTLETCLDKEGLTAFLLPRILGFGIALVAYAAVSFSEIYAQYGLYLCLIFFLVVVAVYLLTHRQARQQFWP